MTRFWGWYRKYFLLLNLPVLLLLTELVLVGLDPAHRGAFDLDLALDEAFHGDPPNGAPVVLLVGNSSTRMGFDRAQLGRELSHAGHPVKAYNFGLGAARIDDTRALTELVFARGLKPKLVVLGVNLFLVDPQLNSDSRFPWGVRRSPYLFFHRSHLRKKIKRLIRRTPGVDDLGIPTGDVVLTDRQREDARRAFNGEFGHRKADDLTLISEIPEYLAWLAAQGIAAEVVIMPLNPDCTGRLDEYAAMSAALKAALPPGALDLGNAYPPELFLDAGHLNATGRAKLTTQVAKWIIEHHPELAR